MSEKQVSALHIPRLLIKPTLCNKIKLIKDLKKTSTNPFIAYSLKKLFLVLIFIMKCNDKIMILFFSKSGSKPEENGLTQISVQCFFLSKEKHKIHLELRLIQSFSLQ